MSIFLLTCIPMRILIAVIVYYSSNSEYFTHIGFLLLLPAIGFLILYTFNLRMNAPEGGGITWWAKIRPIHGLLYLIAAGMALSGSTNAYIPLVIDVVVGLIAYTYKN